MSDPQGYDLDHPLPYSNQNVLLGVTIQMSTQSGLDSRFIRFLNWSKWSHVDLVLEDGRLLGARLDGGVLVRPPNYGNFTDVARYFVPCAYPSAVLQYARSQIGKPYDWRAIANFVFHRSHYWRSEDSWFCSELVAAAFAFSGQPILNLDDCDHITPRDITISPKLIPMIRTESGGWTFVHQKAAGA